MKLMSNLSEETNASGVGVAIGSEMHTPDYCMLPWSAVAMGAAERRANRRGTIP